MVVVIGVCTAGAEEKVSVTPAEPVTAPAIAVERIGQKKPLVQIAVLLDTSSSMSGLIDQAKKKNFKFESFRKSSNSAVEKGD